MGSGKDTTQIVHIPGKLPVQSDQQPTANALASVSEPKPAKSIVRCLNQLASCNQTIRERSVRLLIKTWLPSQTQISDADLKKLWKGLFYCVWHADKAQFQAQLINRLASMLLTLDLPLSLQYFSVFLTTMRREWNGIDAHRLDKFYLLIRRFVHMMFALLKKFSWDLGLVGRVIGILEEGTFGANDKFPGNGVKYHVASVFLEELRPFLPLKMETVELMLKPFLDIMGSSPDKVLLGKVRSNVFDVLLTNGKNLLNMKKSGKESDSSDDVVIYGTTALKMGFAARLFELGSAPFCCQGNRKFIFSLHEQFSKLEKDLASSGIEIPLPELPVDEDEEEVPMLVPVDGPIGDDANGPAVKLMKKRKKSKKASEEGEKDKKKSKKKKKKKKDVILDIVSRTKKDDDLVQLNSENPEEQISNGNLLSFDHTMMSNLQKQFEIVAAEEGLSEGIPSACSSQEARATGMKLSKRKRTKNVTNGKQLQGGDEATGEGDDEDLTTANGGEKSAKKVRFSMKNNLVWKPHTPLPPQSVRIPPSVTPRGSALKKGLSPGPIREMTSSTKKAKNRARTLKKVKRVIRSPAVKRPKKLKAGTP